MLTSGFMVILKRKCKRYLLKSLFGKDLEY